MDRLNLVRLIRFAKFLAPMNESVLHLISSISGGTAWDSIIVLLSEHGGHISENSNEIVSIVTEADDATLPEFSAAFRGMIIELAESGGWKALQDAIESGLWKVNNSTES